MRANQRQLYAVPNQRQAIIQSQPMSIREFTGGDVKSDLRALGDFKCIAPELGSYQVLDNIESFQIDASSSVAYWLARD